GILGIERFASLDLGHHGISLAEPDEALRAERHQLAPVHGQVSKRWMRWGHESVRDFLSGLQVDDSELTTVERDIVLVFDSLTSTRRMRIERGGPDRLA